VASPIAYDFLKNNKEAAAEEDKSKSDKYTKK